MHAVMQQPVLPPLFPQIAFVEACVALDRLKPAARAVRQLQLASEFPNIEALYKQRSLSRLMQKRLWSVALSYAGNDTMLQAALVQGMAEVGELVLAEEFRQQLGLPESTLRPPDPGAQACQFSELALQTHHNALGMQSFELAQVVGVLRLRSTAPQCA
jgi:hypothetical protein